MSRPDLNALIERLERLLAMATKGPWELQDGCSWRRIGTRDGDGNVLCPSTYSSTDRHPDLTAGNGEDLYANLTLIVEAVNALPVLLETILRLSREAEQADARVLAERERCAGIADAYADEQNKTVLASVVARAIRDGQQPQGGWQPIETAPKDGTWLLGWAASDSSPYRISWGQNHNNELAWCTAFGSFTRDYITHWLPLPFALAAGEG